MLTHKDVQDTTIPDNFQQFFHQMGGPTVFHLQGKDPSKTRVVVTLLHGNEPSGLKAFHRYLISDITPQTQCKLVVASVVSARTEPMFTHRMLTGQRDLNRCFNGPANDAQGKLARALKHQLANWQPEAILDIHNTSGSGPAFCVSVESTPQTIALASHFSHRIVVTDIRLGSLMEQAFNCPILTVEAGGAQDEEADENAFEGLCSFLGSKKVFTPRREVETLCHPRRLELKPGVNIAFAEQAVKNVHITMRQDIEKHNFGLTLPDQTLGWVGGMGLDNFQLDINSEKVSDYFRLEEGQLKAVTPLKLFMVTTRADIAKSDCLFYLVR